MTAAFSLSPRDRALLVLLTVTWGVNWPVMKVGVDGFPPITFRALTMIGGLPIMALLVRAQGASFAVPRAERAELLRLTLFNMIGWFLLAIYGVKLLSSGRAAILGYTMPIWAALIGLVVYRERPGRRLGWGLVAAALGVGLLVAGEFETLAGRPVGTLCMLGAAITWAMGTQMMRRRRTTLPVLVITFWSLVVATLVCAVLALLVEHDQWHRAPTTAQGLAMAYNALVIFGFSQWLWFRLAASLPPVASGLSVMAIPIIGLLSGMAMLGESPHWRDLVAMACILVALAMVLLPASRADPPD